MDLNIKQWLGGIIALVVGVIITVTVAVPIIADNQVADTVSNSSALNSMLGVLPILIVVGLIVAAVGMFISSKRD